MSVNPRPLVANIYNPHNQSKAELVAGFVVRKKFFEKIFRDIQTSTMQNPEQHYIIQGLRGMGKTTMLLRIAYEIESTESLKNWLIPVVFNEEEYGISSLSDLWERVAELLEENSTEFLGLYDKIAIHIKSDDYERLALDIIIKTLQANQKKIILLIDNIGDILGKFDERDEQRLREVLMSIPEIRLIGATSIFLENLFDYKRPFFDFFRYQYLEGLTKDEALDLMLKLGEIFHEDSIKNIVENEPHRVEILRRLTGGVVRTMVLLFEIFVENNTGSAFKDLEILIDRVTPLYKSRMDDLPKQQQKIVAHLANFWDAATTNELSEAIKMESKVVSAQLNQLVKNRIVTKIETNTKNHLYRLEERFFNIWFLMRFGKKTDERILWLVKFMEEFIGGDEILLWKRINGHLLAIDNGTLDPKAALYLTEAFAHLIGGIEQDNLINKTREYLETNAPDLAIELGISDKFIQIEANEVFIKENNIDLVIKILKGKKRKIFEDYIELSGYYCLKQNEKEAKIIFEKGIEYLGIKELSFGKILHDNLFLKEEKTLNTKGNFTFFIAKCLFSIRKNKKLTYQLFWGEFLKDHLALKYSDYEFLAYARIWNDDFPDLKKITKTFFNNYLTTIFKKPVSVKMLIMMYLSKKQYNTVYKCFKTYSLSRLRFKPLYFCTLYYLKDEYPTEYLKMPPEMKETVEDLVKEIEQMAIDYA